MQCAWCSADNLPGTTACVQCGRDLAGEVRPPSAADFLPPRSGKGDLLRSLVRTDPRDVRRRAFLAALGRQLVPVGFGVASIVPGLGQLVDGRRLRAAAFAGAAVAVAIANVAAWCTVLSNPLVLLAAVVVLASMVEACLVAARRNAPDGLDRRLVVGLLFCLGAAVALLATIAWAVVNAQYLFLNVGAPMDGLVRGDRVVARRTGPEDGPYVRDERVFVHAGQPDVLLVLAGTLGARADERPQAQGLAGDSIQVVLGLPGERLRLGRGRLTSGGVDLAPSLPRPVPSDAVPVERDLGPDEYLTLQYRNVNVVGTQVVVGVTRGQTIEGRLIGVIGPPEHRRWTQGPR